MSDYWYGVCTMALVWLATSLIRRFAHGFRSERDRKQRSTTLDYLDNTLKSARLRDILDQAKRRSGIDEPGMEIVARNDRVLICKIPGYTINHSGVRGLRDDRYVAVAASDHARSDDRFALWSSLKCWRSRSCGTSHSGLSSKN